MLFFALRTEPDALKESIEAYKRNIGNAVPICGAVNNQSAGFVNGLCGRQQDRDEIRQLAAIKTVEHTFHGSNYMLNGWPNDEPPPSYAHVTAGDTKMFQDAIAADPQAVADGLLESGFVMAGTPEDCLPVVEAFAQAGVDQLIVHMQMGNVPHQRIMESIELFGTEVISRFR